jgi:putative glutamine amidotransferase
VNSIHHQAVDRPGRDLVISATAPDGVVEAVEDPAHPFFVGVQWHPEEIQEEPGMRSLLRSFVAASAEHAERGAARQAASFRAAG